MNINKVGGNALSFSVDDMNIDKLMGNNICKIKINLPVPLTVSGKLINVKRIGGKKYCEFEYINTPENVKDKIIKLVFEKRINYKD